MSVPNRPILLVDESPFSVVIRLANMNGWCPRDLLNAYFEGDVTQELLRIASRRDGITELLRRSGLETVEFADVAYTRSSSLPQASFTWNGLEARFDHFRIGYSALCPECLLSDPEPYSRILWDHKFVRSCRVHNVELLESCTDCSRPIDWNRSSFTHCECGADFRGAQTKPIRHSEHSFLLDLIASGRSDHLDEATTLSLILEDMACSDPGSQGHSSSSLAATIATECLFPPALFARTGDVAVHMRVCLSPLISNGHQSLFEKLLNNASARALRLKNFSQMHNYASRPMSASILGLPLEAVDTLHDMGVLKSEGRSDSAFRISLSSLNDLLLNLGESRPSLPPGQYPVRVGWPGIGYRKLFSQVVSGDALSLGFDLVDGLRSLRTQLAQREKRQIVGVTIKELADRCQVHYESIRFLAKIGFLPFKRQGNASIPATISEDQADDFVETYCFAGPLARKAGTGHTSFAEKLVFAGVHPVSGPRIDGGLSYLFRRADVEGTVLSQVAAVTNYPTATGRPSSSAPRGRSDDLPLADAAVLLGISVQKTASLCRTGVLIRVKSLSRGVLLEKGEVQRLAGELTSGAFVTFKEAAQQLEERPGEFRRRWLATGIIRSRRIGPSLCIAITDLDVLKTYKESGALGPVTARSNGLPRTYLNNRLRSDSPLRCRYVGRKLKLAIFEYSSVDSSIADAKDGDKLRPHRTFRTARSRRAPI